MFDLNNYSEKKIKNLIGIFKNGNTFIVAIKKFNPDTGETLPDEITTLNIDELVKRREELSNMIAQIDAFLLDCAGL